jgi:hypothetical protein
LPPKENEHALTDAKLDVMIKLLAAIYTKGSNKTDAITKLAGLQLSNPQISEIVGVSGHHVSQVRHAKKKSAAKEEKGRAGGVE